MCVAYQTQIILACLYQPTVWSCAVREVLNHTVLSLTVADVI